MLYLIIIVFLIFVFVIAMYNRFISLKFRVGEGRSGIDVQLKRRYDLVLNLVEVVKGYAKHEQSLFEKVTELRSKAVSPESMKDRINTENDVSKFIRSIFAVAENYPELKASQNFIELQKTLGDIEEQIQYARRYYNGIVRDYNILVEAFPSNILARIFGFTKEEFFEIELSTQKEVPQIKF